MRMRAVFVVLGVVFGSIGLTAAARNVTIQEWGVPTANLRPHDPEVAPDGALWYRGQLANKLGLYLACSGVNKIAVPRIRAK